MYASIIKSYSIYKKVFSLTVFVSSNFVVKMDTVFLLLSVFILKAVNFQFAGLIFITSETYVSSSTASKQKGT